MSVYTQYELVTAQEQQSNIYKLFCEIWKNTIIGQNRAILPGDLAKFYKNVDACMHVLSEYGLLALYLPGETVEHMQPSFFTEESRTKFYLPEKKHIALPPIFRQGSAEVILPGTVEIVE